MDQGGDLAEKLSESDSLSAVNPVPVYPYQWLPLAGRFLLGHWVTVCFNLVWR